MSFSRNLSQLGGIVAICIAASLVAYMLLASVEPNLLNVATILLGSIGGSLIALSPVSARTAIGLVFLIAAMISAIFSVGILFLPSIVLVIVGLAKKGPKVRRTNGD